MEHVPILKVGEFLMVSIQVDMHDRLAISLKDDLSSLVISSGAKGVLIDISALEIVDSFVGRMLSNIASITQVLGAKTVVVGMRPTVAITIIELGLSLSNVITALNVESGMEMLRINSDLK